MLAAQLFSSLSQLSAMAVKIKLQWNVNEKVTNEGSMTRCPKPIGKG